MYIVMYIMYNVHYKDLKRKYSTQAHTLGSLIKLDSWSMSGVSDLHVRTVLTISARYSLPCTPCVVNTVTCVQCLSVYYLVKNIGLLSCWTVINRKNYLPLKGSHCTRNNKLELPLRGRGLQLPLKYIYLHRSCLFCGVDISLNYIVYCRVSAHKYHCELDLDLLALLFFVPPEN